MACGWEVWENVWRYAACLLSRLSLRFLCCSRCALERRVHPMHQPPSICARAMRSYLPDSNFIPALGHNFPPRLTSLVSTKLSAAHAGRDVPPRIPPLGVLELLLMRQKGLYSTWFKTGRRPHCFHLSRSTFGSRRQFVVMAGRRTDASLTSGTRRAVACITHTRSSFTTTSS